MHTKILKWCGKELKIYEQIFRSSGGKRFEEAESEKTVFHRESVLCWTLNIVQCTVADDNGWVTDCVFIQREMGEK